MNGITPAMGVIQIFRNKGEHITLFDTLQNLKVNFRKENGNFDLDFCVLDLALYFNTAYCGPGKLFQY